MPDLEPESWSDATLKPEHGHPRLVRADLPHGSGDNMPSRIGRYIVIDELGAGGMGVVYAAYDPELDRKVAIKLMYAEADSGRAHRSQALLLREAQALAKLSHPNIVAIHDVGVYAGQVFVAMEFVAGRTVRGWREEAARDWQEILAVFVQAGRGLMAAHAVGLVHRDVKPDNLLVGDDGRVRVADFGVARHDPTHEVELSSTQASGARALATVAGRGARVGTPAYMAPEQHDNEGVGPHSDQFSFCVALYEALYGQRPFLGDTATALIGAIERGVPRRPDTAVKLPVWLERAVLRGLAPDPADRWPSMQALLDVLALERDVRRARWRRRALYAALFVLAGVALYLGGRALQDRRAREQVEAAAQERLKVAAAGIDRLLARGRRAEAEEALRAFVGEPEHRASRAATDAWLLWAERMEAAGDSAANLGAVVEAYTGLPADDPREAPIYLRIARLFRAQWRFDELATLARHAGDRWPGEVATPVWSGLRADAALARRDIAGFLAEVDGGQAGRAREDVAPVLRALNAVSFTALVGEVAHPLDLEGDGRLEVAVFSGPDRGVALDIHRMDAALTPLHTLGPDPALEATVLHANPLSRGPGQPAHIIAHIDGETRLYEVGAGGLKTALAWPDDHVQAVTGADLDGDGMRELYVGTGSYTRKLHRLAPDAEGRWQRSSAHPQTEETGSDINALVSGDFDGDGREELAVAVGPWRAYDVRILQAARGGGLEVGARWRIGHVRALAALRGADGATLLAIAKDNGASSKLAFSASKPDGEPPGLYIVRRRGAELVTVFRVPFPAPDGATQIGHPRLMFSGDIDGDGLDDLVLRYEAPAQRAYATTLIWRQLADGSFVPAALGHVIPQLLGNFDDDPALELLVRTRRGDEEVLAVLGVGDEPLAPVEAPHVPALASELADPVLARAWSRAEDLAGFGLYAAAAEALERRTALAQTREDGRAVRRRAAELYAAAGDHARAAAGHEALAQDGDVDAALAAIDGYERALRLADALRVARAVLGRDDASVEQRARARAASERLAAVVERRDAFELRFDRPLAPSWRISEPLALRVDRVRGALTVDAFGDLGDLMSLPIDLTGGALTLDVELDVERAEWGGQLAVSVRRETGEEVLTLGVTAGGGGGYLRRYSIFTSPESQGRHDFGLIETDDPGVRSTHVLQARLLPEQRMIDFEERGSRPERRSLALKQALRPGRHVLVLRATGVESHGAQQLRAQVRRISIAGAQLAAADAPPGVEHAGADQDVARALVTGQWRDALAGPPRGGLVALWRAVAVAELGRVREAMVALAALDCADPALRQRLRHLLRMRTSPAAPLLRAALGPCYAGLLSEALVVATRMHLDAELQRTWLTLGADLDDLPDLEPAQADIKAELWTMRAAAWQAVGDLDQAARDLDGAARLRERAAHGVDEQLAELELRRAEVHALRGRTAEAFAAVARALERTGARSFMAERLALSARLQPLQTDPRWRALLAGRP